MCKLVAAAAFDFHRNGGGDTRTDTCKYADKYRCTNARTHTQAVVNEHLYIHTQPQVDLCIKTQRDERRTLTYKCFSTNKIYVSMRAHTHTSLKHTGVTLKLQL